MQALYEKLESMTDEQVLQYWTAFCTMPTPSGDPRDRWWDADKGITMDDYGQALDFERSRRGLPA